MTPELTALTLAALLQVVQYALMAVPLNLALGTRLTAGPRDNALPDVPPIPGRLYRAFNNHFEALILFTIAVLIISLADLNSTLTAALAWTYLGARVLYIPAYYFGWTPWRSLIWFVGFLATMLMLLVAVI